MCSQYLGRQLRQFLPRWRWPKEKHLREEVYRHGEPPFDPFPSVQDVIDATLCPFAIFHKIYHGQRGALVGLKEQEGGIQTGNHFHRFIAYLKTEIARGKADSNSVGRLFDKYCHREMIDSETRRSLDGYLRHWLSRKKDELREIEDQKPRVFFEVHVASINVRFKRGVRFPLEGIIDEIDVANRRIIERTLRGREDDDTPPFLEDFQLWLLWKTISSINKSILYKVLGDKNLEDYELIVETPYRDFRVNKDNPKFENWAEDAFAWIEDLTIGGPVVISEAWRNKGHHDKPCTYGSKMEECAMSYFACYYRARKYPTKRGALREVLRPLYRALFYEQIWKHDLTLYQLAYMEQYDDKTLRNELSKLLIGRNVFPAKVIESLSDRELKLEVSKDLITPLLEVTWDKTFNFDIIFGSFSVGLRRKAYLDFDDPRSNIKNGQIIVRIEGPTNIESLDALLIESGLLFREEPWFLKRIIQRALFDLERWGLDKDDKAKEHVTIQLIDTLFGPGRFRAQVEK